MYAYYCFHRNKMSPSQFCFLPRREKATIMAFIDERVKEEAKLDKGPKK